jgi:signal transduction histidine kinase
LLREGCRVSFLHNLNRELVGTKTLSDVKLRNVGDIPGTGLGLAVVNTGVELHRGTGAMESIEGQGTTV